MPKLSHKDKLEVEYLNVKNDIRDFTTKMAINLS